mmetsp:Transcript_42760/g.84694  ORF Transcript_42760/g.84694 Transcript_42760/m.84694 type:complete len:82 (-) Transcript_42760:776-1021(-)
MRSAAKDPAATVFKGTCKEPFAVSCLVRAGMVFASETSVEAIRAPDRIVADLDALGNPCASAHAVPGTTDLSVAEPVVVAV